MQEQLPRVQGCIKACHPWQLDSCGAILLRTPMGLMPIRSRRIGPAFPAGMTNFFP
jgi:hypothetical protein